MNGKDNRGIELQKLSTSQTQASNPPPVAPPSPRWWLDMRPHLTAQIERVYGRKNSNVKPSDVAAMLVENVKKNDTRFTDETLRLVVEEYLSILTRHEDKALQAAPNSPNFESDYLKALLAVEKKANLNKQDKAALLNAIKELAFETEELNNIFINSLSPVILKFKKKTDELIKKRGISFSNQSTQAAFETAYKKALKELKEDEVKDLIRQGFKIGLLASDESKRLKLISFLIEVLNKTKKYDKTSIPEINSHIYNLTFALRKAELIKRINDLPSALKKELQPFFADSLKKYQGKLSLDELPEANLWFRSLIEQANTHLATQKDNPALDEVAEHIWNFALKDLQDQITHIYRNIAGGEEAVYKNLDKSVKDLSPKTRQFIIEAFLSILKEHEKTSKTAPPAFDTAYLDALCAAEKKAKAGKNDKVTAELSQILYDRYIQQLKDDAPLTFTDLQDGSIGLQIGKSNDLPPPSEYHLLNLDSDENGHPPGEILGKINKAMTRTVLYTANIKASSSNDKADFFDSVFKAGLRGSHLIKDPETGKLSYAPPRTIYLGRLPPAPPQPADNTPPLPYNIQLETLEQLLRFLTKVDSQARLDLSNLFPVKDRITATEFFAKVYKNHPGLKDRITGQAVINQAAPQNVNEAPPAQGNQNQNSQGHAAQNPPSVGGERAPARIESRKPLSESRLQELDTHFESNRAPFKVNQNPLRPNLRPIAPGSPFSSVATQADQNNPNNNTGAAPA